MRYAAGLAALALPLTLALAGADDPAAARQELAPRLVTFSKGSLPLPEALAELTAGTGNTVADQRRHKTAPAVALPGGPTAFWPALDAIGRASGIGVSPYLADEGVGLVDAPYRPVPTAYAGIFRIAARRVAVTREEETQTRHCQLALDVAWEPRFRPFYVDLKTVTLTFAPDAANKVIRAAVPGRGSVAVAGRSAVELDVATVAPDRTCPRIAAIDGTVWAVGPSKMLTFTFGKLAVLPAGAKAPAAPPAAVQDGVTVTIAAIRRQSAALLVKVMIENPKGGPAFESFQSGAWLENNRIALQAGQRTLAPTGSQETIRGRRAEIVYEFAASERQPLPAMLDGWTLRYETPGRIVELQAPFVLKDLPLP